MRVLELEVRTTEMQWSRGYHDLLGIAPGKAFPSFAAILQVTHPEDRGPQAEVERIIKGVHHQAKVPRYTSGRQYRLDLLPDHRFR